MSSSVHSFKSPGAETNTEPSALELAQTALRVELYTISLYLFALYSLENSGKSNKESAGYKIRRIVIDEMKHVAYAGNLICYLGGQPSLYEAIPIFPAVLFKKKFPLDLQSFDKNLATFIEIEHPEADHKVLADEEILDKDVSIGAFYKKLQKKIKALPDGEAHPESGPRQYTDMGVNVITTPQEAEDAITLIITQGEGGGPKDKTSHWKIFQGLQGSETLKSHTVGKNPKTKDCPKADIKKVMLAFDAAYCYLLLILEKLWYVEGDARVGLGDSVRPIMMDVLRPLANFLVHAVLQEDPEERAAPAFNFYPFEHAKPLEELTLLAEDAHMSFKELEGVLEAVKGLADVGELPLSGKTV